MRSENEFNWTPVPSLVVYALYRLNENSINNKEVHREISSKFNMKDSRTVENKILNYRFLSGEGRGLKHAAKVAAYIVESFDMLETEDYEYLFNSIMENEKLDESLNQFLINVTYKWLADMPLSKAQRYLRLATLHGLNISGNEVELNRLLVHKTPDKRLKQIAAVFEDESDGSFQESINELVIEIHQNRDRNDREPKKRVVNGKEQWVRDPFRAYTALCIAEFKCEIDESHTSFLSAKSGKPFMEAHHLIPIHHQDSFEVNLDVVENIVSLCPNCHRAIHLGEIRPRGALISVLYEKKKVDLRRAELRLSKAELKKLY